MRLNSNNSSWSRVISSVTARAGTGNMEGGGEAPLPEQICPNLMTQYHQTELIDRHRDQ